MGYPSLPAPSTSVWCTSPQALRHGLQLAPSTMGGRITCDWMRRSRWSSQKKTGWRRSIGWLKRWTSFRMVLVFVLMSYTIPGLKKTLQYVEPTFHSDRKRSQDTRLSVHLSSYSYHWQRLLPKKRKWFSSRLLLCAGLGSKILRPQGSHVWVISVPKTSKGLRFHELVAYIILSHPYVEACISNQEPVRSSTGSSKMGKAAQGRRGRSFEQVLSTATWRLWVKWDL